MHTNTDDAEDDHDTGLTGGPALAALGDLVDGVADDEGVDGGHCEWRGGFQLEDGVSGW